MLYPKHVIKLLGYNLRCYKRDVGHFTGYPNLEASFDRPKIHHSNISTQPDILLEQRIATLEQQKWIPKLLGYDYEIVYKPDKDNSTTDALSCVVGSPRLDALFVSQAPVRDNIKKEVVSHPYM